MNADMHVEELAELYALGELDAFDRAQVDEHIARCASCLRRVGEAEETVLALERVVQPMSPRLGVTRLQRRRIERWWPAIAAAALIVGLLLPRPFTSPQNPALLALIHSHFSHSQFSGSPGAPPAKAIYARDRSWLYVIVDGAHRYGVSGFDGRQTSMLGMTRPGGATSDLYTRTTKRFLRIELREGPRIIETAAMP